MKLVANLLAESKIRGQLTQGVTAATGSALFTQQGGLLPNKAQRIIAHSRYATNESTDTQPFMFRAPECAVSDAIAVAYNGVVARHKVDWPESIYGGYTSDNDAAVVAECAAADQRHKIPGSFAVAELGVKHLYIYRNGHRPLWWTRYDNAIFVASTRDIILRAFGVTDMVVEKVPHDTLWDITSGVPAALTSLNDLQPDLQS